MFSQALINDTVEWETALSLDWASKIWMNLILGELPPSLQWGPLIAYRPIAHSDCITSYAKYQ